MEIWLWLLVAPVWSHVHPPLELSEWESLDDYRHARNISFSYLPQHIHPEECRHLTEIECQELDDDEEKRRLQFTQEQPREGNIRALVVLVRFQEHQDRDMPSREYFQELCDGTNGMASYFREQSYGKYNIECDVTDWILTDRTEAAAAQGVSGRLGKNGAQVFFHAALDAYANQQELAEGFAWSAKYDQIGNGPGGFTDGNFDALLVIHSGVGAENGVRDCEGQTNDNRIWAQGYPNSNGWDSPFGQLISVGGYGIASAFRQVGRFEGGNCRLEPAAMGIAVHEWFHTFGIPDLYDFSSTTTFGGIGSFGLMASPRGFSNAASPGSLSPWVKKELGWIENYSEIKADGSFSITASQDAPDVYAIFDKFGTGPPGGNQREYLLIENRQKKSFDSGIFGNGGIIIWHVDDFVGTAYNSEGSYPSQPDWPARHYRIAVVQADGLFELEKHIDDGDVGDLWTQGMTLGPGIGGAQPNTDSYQSGGITQTGISISITSPSRDTMTFSVTGLAQADGPTPVPTPFPTPVPTPSPGAPTCPVLGCESFPGITPAPTPSIGSPSCPVLGCGGFQGITSPPTREPGGSSSLIPTPTPTPGSSGPIPGYLVSLVLTVGLFYGRM